jgi:hypothetical protein
MLEFGIPAKNFPLPQRASRRLPIFIGAALALIWTRPRILLIAMVPGVLTVLERRYWVDAASDAFLESFPNINWADYVAVLLAGSVVGQLVACALAATVFHLLRGQRFAFGPGLDTVRRNLLALALLAIFLTASVILPIALVVGDNPLIPSGFPAAATGFVIQWAVVLSMYFAIPIIADVGGSAHGALGGSLKLLRIVWTDALILFIAAIVFTIGVGLVLLPLFLLVGVNFGAPSGGLVDVVLIAVTGLVLALSTAYNARLYLFARSVEAAVKDGETP